MATLAVTPRMLWLVAVAAGVAPRTVARVAMQTTGTTQAIAMMLLAAMPQGLATTPLATVAAMGTMAMMTTPMVETTTPPATATVAQTLALSAQCVRVARRCGLQSGVGLRRA